LSPASGNLDGRVRAVREHLKKRAATAAVIWTVTGVSLLLVVAWFLAGPNGWRPGSDVPAILDGIALVLVLGGTLFYRGRVSEWFAEAPLSSAIETAAGLRPGVVRGSIELARSLPDGVSAALAGRAAERTVADLGDRVPKELAGGLGETVSLWTKRGLGVFGTIAIVLIGLAVASPTRSALAWSSLSSPIGTMRDPVLLPIVVSPGTVEVLRGSDVQVMVQAPGRLGAVLSWQAAGDVARTEVLELIEERGGYLFRSVGAPIDYHVTGDDGSETERFRISPIDPLFVSDLIVSVVYPPHTGLAPDEYRGDPPSLRLPVGTTVSFEGRASRALVTAALVDSTGAQAVSLSVSGATFQGSWSPRVDGVFDWDFVDDQGDPAEIQPEPLMVSVVPDLAPHVGIPLPGRDTILPLNLRQPLILEATDDYGLRRVELVAYRVTSFGDRLEPTVQAMDLGGTRAALARPLLDLRTWGLLPGDTIRYFARAVDNAPGAQTAVTREYILRMPDAVEMQRAAEEELDDVANRLEELAAEAAKQAEANRDQAMETAANEGQQNQRQDQAGFEEREELENALESQEQLASEVDSLRAELEELERMMENAGQADPELSDDLKELQELMEQLNGSDLQQRMEELSDALEEDDLEQANESLSEMAEEQEDFQARLEESLERFRRAAVEQDFRATTSEAEELARQEEALADAMREEDNPELRAEQQEELAERSEQLEDQMERLEERLGQIDEQDAQEGVQKARESLEQAQQQMQQAQQQADQGENQEAGETAEEAAEEMQDVAEELQEAQQEMAQQQMEQAQAALRQTADDALSLARRQTELREQMRGASQERISAMRADEASLLQGVQNMADNLQMASQGGVQGQRELSAQMGMSMESIQKTIAAMENRRGATPSPTAQAEQTVGDLNQLALMAIAGAEQMSQQGEGQSGEEVSEQLEQLAQQQAELMNQTSQVMPMELGEQAMAEQMQEMAQGQESVADELGELADEPGAEESLGDLQQLADEAAAIAQQLAQGRLTPDMTQRQERLFHRLLDAGRSLEREEYSDERESETPEAFERGQVIPLTADQMGALRFQLPDASQLQNLSPAVRQLVIQYFDRLNRGGSGGSGR